MLDFTFFWLSVSPAYKSRNAPNPWVVPIFTMWTVIPFAKRTTTPVVVWFAARARNQSLADVWTLWVNDTIHFISFVPTVFNRCRAVRSKSTPTNLIAISVSFNYSDELISKVFRNAQISRVRCASPLDLPGFVRFTNRIYRCLRLEEYLHFDRKQLRRFPNFTTAFDNSKFVSQSMSFTSNLAEFFLIHESPL